MSRLWVFGDSLCRPYNLDTETPAWPDLLAARLGIDLENHSQPAVDNAYIYAAYWHYRPQIQDRDTVIVGWTHPSRHLWIYDPDNPLHQSLLPGSINYQLGNQLWFRGPARQSRSAVEFLNLKPSNSGEEFFDHWFINHYNSYQQRMQFRAYRHSVRSSCSANYYCFYFSQESMTDTEPGLGYAVDFIHANSLQISNTDYHFNPQGHHAWAEHLFNQIVFDKS